MIERQWLFREGTAGQLICEWLHWICQKASNSIFFRPTKLCTTRRFVIRRSIDSHRLLHTAGENLTVHWEMFKKTNMQAKLTDNNFSMKDFFKHLMFSSNQDFYGGTNFNIKILSDFSLQFLCWFPYCKTQHWARNGPVFINKEYLVYREAWLHNQFIAIIL